MSTQMNKYFDVNKYFDENSVFFGDTQNAYFFGALLIELTGDRQYAQTLINTLPKQKLYTRYKRTDALSHDEMLGIALLSKQLAENIDDVSKEFFGFYPNYIDGTRGHFNIRFLATTHLVRLLAGRPFNSLFIALGILLACRKPNQNESDKQYAWLTTLVIQRVLGNKTPRFLKWSIAYFNRWIERNYSSGILDVLMKYWNYDYLNPIISFYLLHYD